MTATPDPASNADQPAEPDQPVCKPGTLSIEPLAVIGLDVPSLEIRPLNWGDASPPGPADNAGAA